MSRSTQYIGLNKYAKEFVKQAIKVEQYEMTTGICDEPVYGNIYYFPVPEGPNKSYYFKETVQCTPWSSGPMIFTNLTMYLEKESGQVYESKNYFNWMLDPTVENEFDYDTGRFYV
jgi:hypothetical protein